MTGQDKNCILVVDDDEDALSLTGRFLETLGMEKNKLLTADGVEAAIKSIQENKDRLGHMIVDGLFGGWKAVVKEGKKHGIEATVFSGQLAREAEVFGAQVTEEGAVFFNKRASGDETAEFFQRVVMGVKGEGGSNKEAPKF